ncbi:MAG: DUF3108 domain-containing protein [Bacteroidales bacterium]|nr:DUF3108 domain-containing protein [Bacteroidales bacterium]
MIFSRIIFFVAVIIMTGVTAQEGIRTVSHDAFRAGEKLQFRFYYDAWLTGKVTAGIGIAEVKETDRRFDAREVWHFDTEGRSKGLFNLFYKVYDQFDSYTDKQALAPYLFLRRTHEGSYVKDDDVSFHFNGNYAVSRRDSMATPPYIQDIVSAVYYARTFDVSNLKIGEHIQIDFFLDDSVYTSVIIFEGREVVDIGMGRVRCMRFKPRMVVGEVFSEQYPMTLWISDDLNKIPILAQSAVIVGNIKMELMEYEGLSHPFTSLIEKY